MGVEKAEKKRPALSLLRKLGKQGIYSSFLQNTCTCCNKQLLRSSSSSKGGKLSLEEVLKRNKEWVTQMSAEDPEYFGNKTLLFFLLYIYRSFLKIVISFPYPLS